MTIDRIQRYFLLLIGAGLPPVALIYGVAPEQTMPMLFNVEAADVGTKNVFRGIMGVYLALAAFWIMGAMRPTLRRGALWTVTLFMAGVGAGRILSLILDGWPHPLLVFFTGLELAAALTGVILLRARAKSAPSP